MKLALLSNVTADFLVGELKKNNEVYTPAGYDTWQQELINPASPLYEFKPEAAAVLIHADAYTGVWENRSEGCSLIDEWCDTFKVFLDMLPGVPLFVSNLDISNSRCHYGSEHREYSFLENYFIECIETIHDSGSSIYLLPVKDAVSFLGRSSFYSSKMWYFGSMPYSTKGIKAIAGLIDRYASAGKGAKKKCLAIDLDNTLWGGVIGEDGIEGIILSNNKEGARYKDAQRFLKRMKERGVMLAIVSKNNPEDVEPVFSHPDMILEHEDFVGEAINWESKSTNIRQLAADLNIGLDAFVFLDDNPAEREQMKAECPEVTVADFPKDTSQLPEAVANIYENYFFTLEVTGEDIKKTDMYRAESRRKAEKSAATSVEDYLKNLSMTMDFHIMKPEEEKRVTQLVNKTNQFNVTTIRYSEEDIHSLADHEDSDVLTVHMADKYGEQGLVSVIILRYEKSEAAIDSFLMSCRVMGRNAELEIMHQVKQLLEKKGKNTIKAKYIKTAKNKPVEELFDKIGFTLLSDDAREIGDEKLYSADISDLPASTGLFSALNGD